ncbi:MAG: metal ABC transporter substrate-binding protein [Bacillota bacterium]|nr:metal ABC transporter substrate-binding protein [Bacillota bacterium]
MKKIIFIILVITMALFSLSACEKDNVKEIEVDSQSEKIKIVTTIFPTYDWVQEVIKGNEDKFELTLLIDSGVDLHSYQPTADDIMEISNCDLFIYVGGESDKLIEDALKESINKDMKVVNLLEVLGDYVKTEEMIEGMQESEHSHNHGHNEDHSHDEHEHEEEHNHHGHHAHEDEHVWLSLKNANKLVDVISNTIQEIDIDNKDVYKTNASNYIEKLNELDNEYQDVVSNSDKKVVLFGDRFPFRYLVDDYGLEYYAAFVGCSTDSEASFETIAFLAKKVDEYNLNSVLTIENSDKKIAKTIIQNTNSKKQKILVLDSMQSITSNDIDNNANYISIMESNLEILKEALK